MLETLRGEGAPPPACRAVVHAALRYVDAELLNALMLRRDACSISAVKALQARQGCRVSCTGSCPALLPMLLAASQFLEHAMTWQCMFSSCFLGSQWCCLPISCLTGC